MKKLLFMFSIVMLFSIHSFAQEASNQSNVSDKGFRVSLGGGYARLLGNQEKLSDPVLEKFSKDLMNGFVVDFDAQYFFNPTWGIGLNSNYIVSNAELSNYQIEGVTLETSIRNSPVYYYVGPSLVSKVSSKKFMLLSNIGLGPLFFTDRLYYGPVQITGKKTTIGFNAGLAGEYSLTQKLGVGIKASYTMGTIKSITVAGQQVDSPESVTLSNLMFSLFLSFRTW
jgi:hypothetical protein